MSTWVDHDGDDAFDAERRAWERRLDFYSIEGGNPRWPESREQPTPGLMQRVDGACYLLLALVVVSVLLWAAVFVAWQIMGLLWSAFVFLISMLAKGT